MGGGGTLSRLIGNVAGLSVIILCATLVWGITTGSICSTLGASGPAAVARPTSGLALPIEPVPHDGAAVIGAVDAPVTILEYSDFGCPYCAQFATETLPAIDSTYIETGRLRLIYKHYPIVALHPNAVSAAAAASCASQRGRFREMHDALFSNPSRQHESALAELAAVIGLDPDEFALCLTDRQTLAVIQAESDEAGRLGVMGTPAFFIGVTQPDGSVRVTEAISGSRPLTVFEAAIERALEAALVPVR